MHGLLDGFSALSGKIPNAIPGLKSPSRADLWAAITASCLTNSSGARFAGLTNPGSSANLSLVRSRLSFSLSLLSVIFLNTRQSWLLKPTPNNPRRVKPLPLQYIPNRQHLNPAALDPINLQIPGLRHIPVKTPKGN